MFPGNLEQKCKEFTVGKAGKGCSLGTGSSLSPWCTSALANPAGSPGAKAVLESPAWGRNSQALVPLALSHWPRLSGLWSHCISPECCSWTLSASCTPHQFFLGETSWAALIAVNLSGSRAGCLCSNLCSTTSQQWASAWPPFPLLSLPLRLPRGSSCTLNTVPSTS